MNTLAIWPFAVSVGATGATTTTADHTQQAASLAYKCGMTGSQIWEAMVLTNKQRAAEIRNNTPEALV